MVPLVTQKVYSAVKDLREFLAKSGNIYEGTPELQQANEYIVAGEAIKL